jgi:hypothetical protein
VLVGAQRTFYTGVEHGPELLAAARYIGCSALRQLELLPVLCTALLCGLLLSLASLQLCNHVRPLLPNTLLLKNELHKGLRIALSSNTRVEKLATPVFPFFSRFFSGGVLYLPTTYLVRENAQI